MKKININYIKAYLQMNLGDDMLVDLLVRRYPYETFYIFCDPKKARAFKHIDNVRVTYTFTYKVICLLNKLRIIKSKKLNPLWFHSCKSIIRIGGSIFKEPSGWNDKQRKSYITKDTFYIGCNFGPCVSESFYQEVYRRIQTANSACFRDSYSFNMFKKLENVRQAPDCLFGYLYEDVIAKKNLIGISVISLEERKNLRKFADDYYASIGRFVNYVLTNGYSVRMFSFCEAEGDKKAIDRILSMCGKTESIEVVNYNGDIRGFLNSYGECEHLLATRFHGSIIGWSMGRNVIPIIYSNKQTNVFSDLQYNGFVWDVLSTPYMEPELLYKKLTSNACPNVEKEKKESVKQFECLDSFFN